MDALLTIKHIQRLKKCRDHSRDSAAVVLHIGVFCHEKCFCSNCATGRFLVD